MRTPCGSISARFIGALTALVFAASLIECNGPLPDLVPKELSFDANNVLTVTFKTKETARCRPTSVAWASSLTASRLEGIRLAIPRTNHSVARTGR